MSLGWIKHLPIIALLISAIVTISGCNTIGGTLGGVGRDISAIGDTFSEVAGSDCRSRRCDRRKAYRDCGRGGCRKLRSVVSRCQRDGCGRRHRPLRY